MIKSMTGFGRCELSEGPRKVTIEIKSVNHRYLEAGIKMPKKLNVFESRIRDVLKQYASRGKVDIFITFEDSSESKVLLRYNQDVAKEYVQIFDQIATEYSLPNDMTVSGLVRMPEVITMEEAVPDDEVIWHFIEKAMNTACQQFSETRIREGAHLKDDLIAKLEHMNELVAFIESESASIIGSYREQLEHKVKELLADTPMDESRIATEVVLYADKICIDEETVRLHSHIDHAIQCLQSEGGVGRKLDFIAQEMNRESNTILSKANDIHISDKAIELKTEIEKVREQIQNIE